jgi:hypothetical protein
MRSGSVGKEELWEKGNPVIGEAQNGNRKGRSGKIGVVF